jgi:hypothetical protein
VPKIASPLDRPQASPAIIREDFRKGPVTPMSRGKIALLIGIIGFIAYIGIVVADRRFFRASALGDTGHVLCRDGIRLGLPGDLADQMGRPGILS